MGLLARALRGTWRVAVVEESMAPTVRSGDWLLLDPTGTSWPRPGSLVVFREPDSDLLAIKRVAARGRAPTRSQGHGRDGAAGHGTGHVRIDRGLLHLEPDEAWLLGDVAERSIDSRRYGPVPFDRYVGRVWLRYAPIRRMGSVGSRRGGGRSHSPDELLAHLADHVEVPGQQVLEHQPLDAGTGEPPDRGPGLVERAGDPASSA